MNVELINPFIQGAQNIMEMVCNEKVKLGKIFLKNAPYKCEYITILIGMTGQIRGQVIFNMSNDTACLIASKMMMGMPVPVLDEMSRSAISELTNMISGNAATLYSAQGRIVDITTPALTIGATEMEFSELKSSPFICIPLSFSDGSIFEIDILIPGA